jgi:tRNA threonylcarbamoyladenosine biosynthesis protein TsaB
MIRTLAIDTSTKTASIALLYDDEIRYEVTVNAGLNHSVVLLPAINHMMHLAGLMHEEIDLFACTIGPGSFTGLRIAAGTVKGFAMALGRPIAGISSLDALSLNAASSTHLICPMLDARKGQVYTALYKSNAGGYTEKITADKVTHIDSILADVEKHGKIVFLGDGAAAYRELITGSLGEKAAFMSPAHQYIRASAVGLLGVMNFKDGKIVNPVNLAPHYLRLSEAEVKQAYLSS